MPDMYEDSTGTTDTLGCVFREGPMRTLCSLRTGRLRAPTTTRAYRTFSLDRGVDVLEHFPLVLNREDSQGVVNERVWRR